MNRLSERLLHIAAQVANGEVLADVGCDHGYLPIALVKDGVMQRAIAMDVNEGPLQRAAEHIAAEQLGEYIQTRRSDGLERLQAGEADAVIIAGMGGALTIDILTRGQEVVRSLKQLILEPQSEIAAVRRFLREQNYRIMQEDLVCEDGKYYPILRVLPMEESDVPAYAAAEGLPMAVADAYGHRLLEQRHPVLAQYLHREQAQCRQILAGLPQQTKDAARIEVRRQQLLEQLQWNRTAQAYMKRDGIW